MQTVWRTLFAVGAAVVASVCAANAAELPNAGTPDPGIAKQDAAPVFYVDNNTVTPAMAMYLDAVREKIRRSGTRDWPKDRAGKNLPGEVVVQITLQKDGFIRDIQTVPIADRSVADSNNALGEAVTSLVKGAQPFAPFPPSLFAGCELIAFGTTVGTAQGAGQPAGKPRVDALGNNQRLEMRTRIPF